MRNEARLRSMLEIATAILLGLVSVATAAGAYQASEWSQQAGAYAATAGQLRDASLSTNIASLLASYDDGDRIAQALAIEFDLQNGAADGGALRARQEVLLAAGSPGLEEAWDEWIANGYSDEYYPLVASDLVSAQLAPTYAANRASAVAYHASDQIGARGLLITVASAIFALALLLLGVSGANASIKVALALAIGGAAAFVGGVVVSVFAIVG
jgi:hypothetical protein